MVWTLRVSFLLFVALLIFLVSPFVALYELAKAVQTRDMARIESRVNFRALRTSFSRQIVGDFLKTSSGEQSFGGLDSNVAANAGAVALDPFVEQLVTPQAMIDLLEDGWTQAAAGAANAATSNPLSYGFGSLDLDTLRKAWRLFILSESQGFRSISMPLPPDLSKDKQFRLTWRLSGTTWRLTGIELPRALREELLRRMPQSAG
ncbi:DUF2939 domain-containing protein [Microvirga sp. 2TAF3]|uniref:DUF2939 domain-containing protein n=1 Tax=Microvirga sp. 2TAF3 TaxID=3233014 RepID=UPI003F94F5CC